MRVDVDPTINDCALVLAEEARAEIEKQYLARHVSHHMLREEYLFKHVPVWIKTYGKPTADQAVRWLLSMPLELILSKGGKRADDAWFKRERLSALKYDRPKRNNWINRTCIRLIGLPLYGLVIALGASQAAPPAEARDRGRRDHLALCAAAKPSERHSLGCWRFGPSEIDTYRPWDGERWESPSWERKRSWEIDD